MLSTDPDRACYGLPEVLAANEQLAIADLLISDAMYRAKDYNERNKYCQLMESVEQSGGRVFKFSSLHGSGEQLNMYTGIAATLRFPIVDLAELALAERNTSPTKCEKDTNQRSAPSDDDSELGHLVLSSNDDLADFGFS